MVSSGGAFDQLITTKLKKPRLQPGHVSRLRLVQKLDAGIDRPLTLISAPAGFGKTTLLAEWVARTAWPVGWYSLDEHDNDLERFVSYLMSAVSSTGVTFRDGLSNALYFPEERAIQGILAPILNDVEAHGDHIVVVLDDYHWVSNREIHETVSFVSEHQPENLHLVISTRSDPPIPLARLRGHGDMAEIVASDLRFTQMEAVDFYGHLPTVALTVDEVADLTTATEGWVAALQMAALGSLGPRKAHGSIRIPDGPDRYISQYLIEEVVDRQSEEIRHFLLTTSVLDRFSASLCDTILATANSADLIEEVAAAGLFLFAFDEKREWFRYHPLFAGTLRDLLNAREPERAAAIHSRASDWFGEAGFLVEAVNHALRAGDIGRQASLVNDHVDELWSRGRQAMLLQWLSGVPDDEIRRWPKLCVYHAFESILVGDPETAKRRLEDASHPAGGDPDDGLSGMVAAVRAWVAAYSGDTPTIERFIRIAQQTLPESATDWRCSIGISLGDAATLDGQMEAADRHFADAAEIARDADNLYYRLLSTAKWTFVLWCRGELGRVVELSENLLRSAERTGLSRVNVVGYLAAHYAAALTDRGELENAVRMARRAISACSPERITLVGWRYVFLAKALLCAGDVGGARECLTEFDDLRDGSGIPEWLRGRLVALSARVHLDQGEIRGAQSVLGEYGECSGQAIPFGFEECCISQARLHLETGALDEGIKILDRLHDSAVRGDHRRNLVEILVLKTVALHRKNKHDPARDALREAIQIAEPEGFIQVFVDDGPRITKVLSELASGEAGGGFAGTALALLRPENGANDPRKRVIQTEGWIEPLSDREIEVLQLIAEGLTNKEVGDRLFISVATVKWHSGNIFGKIGVANRTHAVAKARQLGILSPK